MEMLLRNITMTDLAAIFERHRDQSSVPYLIDSKSVDQARHLAKNNGIWEDLNTNLDASRDIPVIKRSAFRNYQRVGDRTLPQSKAGYRRRELERAAMALWLDHPKADLDYLQDLLWAYCDDRTWVMAAHEGRAIDLGSAALGATFAEILYVLGDRLEGEVKERVSREIERRIFQNFWDYNRFDTWKTVRMNWNHVCNGEIIRTALYQIADARILAHFTHAAIQNLTYALDGFTDDGGCEEGPGYWAYGFGHFLYVAHALYLKTSGELNLMTDEKIRRICEYPLAADISSPLRSTFADSSHGHIPFRIAMIINEFFDMPALYALCARSSDDSLRLSGMHELASYAGQKSDNLTDNRDYLLPNLGQVKLRGVASEKRMTLMAIAGNTGVPHNHNDIGSFILHRGDRIFLVDPGGPLYTRKTFSAQRYEIVFCNSIGHSVPVINNILQQPGSQYYGTLTVENLNGAGQKRAIIDMTHANPAGTVKQLLRTFTLDAEANRLTMEDTYTFDETPRCLEEGFITFEEVTLSQDGQSVKLGAQGNALCLTAINTPGAFSTRRLVEESKEGRTDEVITRITFAPDKLDVEMCLRFEIS
ncbi:MAG: hypothetical protein ACE1ZS_08620 [Candidatus Poribacteria bacterium]